MRSNSLTLSSAKRKNLSQHLGLDLENLNQSTRDMASAQRIALTHLQARSKCSSKKDLNKFLGINDSPVKLRNTRRNSQNRNSFSFMETFMSGKFFQGKGGRRGDGPEPDVETSLDRKRLEDFYDAESYDKSRSSSFSSTGSSSVFSTGSSTSTSLGSSHNSVSRLFHSAVSSDFVNSLRLSGAKRRNSIQSVFDIKPTAPVEQEDISEFVENGLPIIPFSSQQERKINVSPAGHTNFERAGHSLDAVISFARLELSKGKSMNRGRQVWDESIYMDMSPNTSGEIYMDMDVLRPSHNV